jgi:hypothetical protein
MVLSSNITVVKEIEIPEAFIRLRSDSILHVHYKRNTTLDVELQVRMRNIFNEMTGGLKSNFIFSAAEGFALTKEARENSTILDSNSPISAYAVIANNLAYRIIANFYLKVNKPTVPYKLFQTIEEAVKWLYTQ